MHISDFFLSNFRQNHSELLVLHCRCQLVKKSVTKKPGFVTFAAKFLPVGMLKLCSDIFKCL